MNILDESISLQHWKTVLICGTRNPISLSDEKIVISEIDKLNDKYGVCNLICDTRTSVDRIAARRAAVLGWNMTYVGTNWKDHKKNAISERTSYICNAYSPHIVLAFPGPDSNGTMSIIRNVYNYNIQYGSKLEEIITRRLDCTRVPMSNM